jgi:endoglucanase
MLKLQEPSASALKKLYFTHLLSFMKYWIILLCTLHFFSCSSPDQDFIEDDRLPLTEKMFYQENTVERGVDRLLDGNLQVNFDPGARLLNTGPHTIVCNFPEEWQTIPTRIRIFDGGSGDPFSEPTKFLLVRKSDGAEIEVGTFEGNLYKQWKDLKIEHPFASDRLIIRGYSHNGAGAFYGTELEVYGKYNRYTTTKKFVRKARPLKNMLGTNGFVWDFMQDPKDPSHVQHAYAPKLNRHIEMGISSERFYMTLADLEPKENEFAFNPSKGGWYYDSLFTICKRAGIEPLPDIMGLAPHMFNTWPDNDKDRGNQHPNTYSSPVRYEDRNRREEPRSYRDIAHAAFVTAARWGFNAGIDEKLLGAGYDGRVRGIPPNSIKRGLGLIRYIEFLNEPNSYWGGVYEYMSGYKLAAFLSAIYDGHKKTIDAGYGPGVGVGIRNADSTMQLVISGFSRANTDALKAIADWSRIHRGLKADGSVDLPYDVINYHKYSTDAGMLGESSPNTTAMAPELSGVLNIASDFVEFSNETSGKEVWLTEWGFDYHPDSWYAAPTIGNQSSFEVIGAWAVRNVLLHSLRGVDRLMWFKTFDDDSLNKQFFSTMSLLSAKDPFYARRVVADYFAQMKQFGDYMPDSLLSTKPYVARFKKEDGSLLYAVWGVEKLSTATIRKQGKKVNSFHFEEGSGKYVINLPGTKRILVKRFVPGSIKMEETMVELKDGNYAVDYGLTPVMIELEVRVKK